MSHKIKSEALRIHGCSTPDWASCSTCGMLEAFGRDCAAQAIENEAKEARCMASQLPEGHCGDTDDDEICQLCLQAARMEGRAAALRNAEKKGE